MDPAQKETTTMKTATTARWIIENASGHIADDLGDQGRGDDFGWETEAAAEAALEDLAKTTGWDVSDYSVREATAEEIAHDALRVARSLEIARRARLA